jgi:hypothetical protein
MIFDAKASEFTCAWERVFGVRLRDVPAAVWSRFLVRRPVMETRLLDIKQAVVAGRAAPALARG